MATNNGLLKTVITPMQQASVTPEVPTSPDIVGGNIRQIQQELGGVPPQSEVVLKLWPTTFDLVSDGNVEIHKTRIEQDSEGFYNVTLKVRVLAALFLMCLLTSCGYTGSFTIGYTGQTPAGNDINVGLSLPLNTRARTPAPLPVVTPPESAKEAHNILP